MSPQCTSDDFFHILSQIPTLAHLTLAGKILVPELFHPDTYPGFELQQLHYLMLSNLEPLTTVQLLRLFVFSADRRQAPLGPDTPLFGSRIPPGTSTQSPNTSILPSTLFDTFDGPLDAARPKRVIRSMPHRRSRSFPIRYRTSQHAFTMATGPKWPYVSLHLRIRHDVTLRMNLMRATRRGRFVRNNAKPLVLPFSKGVSRVHSKTVIECNRFLSQLRIYWLINTSLTTIELKVQVALSLLDGDARAWATPYFAQLVSVQIGTQGVTTPFANEAAFAAAFRARFGNLDDEAAAQVELAKLCADKTVREKRTAAEFSALFKGPADRSGYGDLELRDKYLSGIPSRVYRKIELETFTTWKDAEKCVTEVEQILDISWACWPELNNFLA
ncbi:predicted protein [Postia placenta Mad-698-R]|uniref:Retrotransposon gag domain-containing protein n=1 Tax=Postia placenta MAD-698-R-SB12 TaxID=670580 RepID=A0A1X6MQF6_9APHY|nr:hypothetical protein POSPLADRAFT_1152764 [Postia placenta MAD-698-R-SB12]EED79655.1 predicted protein [Postia placenta Mad-698-R]OSX58530.1 hypothetical protein POSPLADRAFT_1152764 [Postia placenta MAD-698-R-SB12]